MNTLKPNELLTVAQVAEILCCNAVTVRRMIARGELPAYKYGRKLIRIDRRDLDEIRKPVTRISEVLGGTAA